MVDWREIPGNLDVFEQLQELLASGEAVAFVGAGASAGLYPLWPQLIGMLADRVVRAGKVEASAKGAWLKGDALQAARQIRDKLGEGTFAEEIRRIFGPKAKDPRFTPVHAALAHLGFRAFVTTNYDPALTLACREAHPKLSVEDFDGRHDRVGLWLQGRPAGPGELPILHAHGRYDGRESLVLDARDYRRAYGGDRYRRLFEDLWTREQLVVVGFSFQDPWLRIVADQVLFQAGTREVSGRRHVALIGLSEEDFPHLDLRRDGLEEQYHLRVLFYPVTRTKAGDGSLREDHSALHEILEALKEAPAVEPAAPPPAAPALPEARADLQLKVWPPPEYPKRPYPLLLPYSHPKLLAGREDELDDLRARLSSPIPILGLYAPSGAGKSSLLQAGLVPQLRAQGVPVAYERHLHESGLASRLLGHLLVGPGERRPEVGEDPRAFVEHLKLARRLARVPPALVLDQFEDVLGSPEARARVGPLLAATVREQLAGEPPLCHWVLAHRQDFHGDLRIWLEDVLVEARKAEREVEGLPCDLLQPDRFQAWHLPLLGAPRPGDDGPEVPFRAFLAAIRKPLELTEEDGVPWSPRVFAGDGAERLARAFAEFRLERREAPLTPELQVVLAHLEKDSATDPEGNLHLVVGEVPRALVEDALASHVQRVLKDAFPISSQTAARHLRTIALLALGKLANAQLRTGQGLGATRLAEALGEDGEEILERMAAPDARLLIAQEDAGDVSGKRYALSHDRLTDVILREVNEESAELDSEVELLRLWRVVNLNSELFHSGQARQATDLDLQQYLAVNDNLGTLLWKPEHRAWWDACQERAAQPAFKVLLDLNEAVEEKTRLFAEDRKGGAFDLGRALTDQITVNAEKLLWNEPRRSWWKACQERARVRSARGRRLAFGAVAVGLVFAIAAGVWAFFRVANAEELAILRGGDPRAAFSAVVQLAEGGVHPDEIRSRLEGRDLLELFEQGPTAEGYRLLEGLLAVAAIVEPLVDTDHVRTMAVLLWHLDRVAEKGTAEQAARARGLKARLLKPWQERHRPPERPPPGHEAWADFPGGHFTMGSRPGEGGHSDEQPAHEVIVSRFRMLRHEAKVEELQRLFPNHPGQAGDPAVDVSWYQAYLYAAWLGGRLPTEAEWEFAAKAGCESPTGYCDADGRPAELEEVAWYEENSGRELHHGCTTPKRTPYGLCDLFGNAWEWVGDSYGSYQDASQPVLNPWGPPRGEGRVFRGGSAWNSAVGARAAYRDGGRPGNGFGDRGFRVVLPVPEQAVEAGS